MWTNVICRMPSNALDILRMRTDDTGTLKIFIVVINCQHVSYLLWINEYEFNEQFALRNTYRGSN